MSRSSSQRLYPVRVARHIWIIIKEEDQHTGMRGKDDQLPDLDQKKRDANNRSAFRTLSPDLINRPRNAHNGRTSTNRDATRACDCSGAPGYRMAGVQEMRQPMDIGQPHIAAPCCNAINLDNPLRNPSLLSSGATSFSSTPGLLTRSIG